ncbi:hypothetical protein ACBY01_13415 [Sphingomonas sp. ac-8]|uniref:hypothetical protein n=1 Tax=Sphingomonas sp. ac-8 TaxID=3242977 RepID=UPI003A805A2B
MQVIDHAPYSWFLLAAGDALLFDAYCNHSALGYSWLIELNAQERQAYARGGRAYLDRLAQDIHNGVPILKISTSPYRTRNREAEFADAVTQAIRAWRADAREG